MATMTNADKDMTAVNRGVIVVAAFASGIGAGVNGVGTASC